MLNIIILLIFTHAVVILDKEYLLAAMTSFGILLMEYCNDKLR